MVSVTVSCVSLSISILIDSSVLSNSGRLFGISVTVDLAICFTVGKSVSEVLPNLNLRPAG
jgi:hypothetical protein